MEDKNKEKEQQEYLEKYLHDQPDDADNLKKVSSPSKPESNSLDYLNVDLDLLPTGIFYKKGTKIKIRGAKVKEVQAYSVVDDKNYIDVTEKMNQMLSSCVKFINPDGSEGSYKQIKDSDRLFLIFMIRELTFQKGNSLAKDVECEHCKNDFKIQFRATPNEQFPRTFVNYEMPEELQQFFDSREKVFKFDINGVQWELAPPTIGIQEIFFGNIKEKVNTQKTPNVSFLKIIPHILHDRDTIKDKEIKDYEKKFEDESFMDMETFQFLNQAVDRMKFGIKELKMKCPECSGEVCTDLTFPTGASGLFVIPDYFDKFTKK